jgi:hypothetical protein
MISNKINNNFKLLNNLIKLFNNLIKLMVLSKYILNKMCKTLDQPNLEIAKYSIIYLQKIVLTYPNTKIYLNIIEYCDQIISIINHINNLLKKDIISKSDIIIEVDILNFILTILTKIANSANLKYLIEIVSFITWINVIDYILIFFKCNLKIPTIFRFNSLKKHHNNYNSYLELMILYKTVLNNRYILYCS